MGDSPNGNWSLFRDLPMIHEPVQKVAQLQIWAIDAAGFYEGFIRYRHGQSEAGLPYLLKPSLFCNLNA
jgi:hypothetical protein